jgi:hypothetical protein
MTARRTLFVFVLLAGLVLGGAPGHARTVGQIIDDATITTEITAKLAADQLSSLAKIGVKAHDGIVTLSGKVDSQERKAKAAQIASSVDGVKGLVNNIEVTGAATTSTPPAQQPTTGTTPSAPGLEATGTVAAVDAASGTITLQDGRILKTTDRTTVWQPTTLSTLTPGSQVLIQGAVPAPQPSALPAQRP